MKTAQRHQLKTNEVAEQITRAREYLTGHGSQLTWFAGAVLVLAILVGGFYAWRQGTQERAGAALAEAMTVADAEVIEPGSNQLPSTGSFFSTEARSEAAIKKFQDVIREYPSSRAATSAKYQAASLLASTGKRQEAEQYFREVMTGDSGIYGRMARMALAELQVADKKYDDAIATFRELAGNAQTDLPVDGVLMHLARAYQSAGKKTEAAQTYQRIVTEFPDSIYASDAKKSADELKSSAAS